MPTSGRGTWEGIITFPATNTTSSNKTSTTSWSRPLAILTKTGLDFQDNAADPRAYQYWAELTTTPGSAIARATIPRVKAGAYRLTVLADGLFGQHVVDDIAIAAGSTTTTRTAYAASDAGTELWRIGTPDRSSGEYRHGVERDEGKPLRPEQYRIYWAVYDFPTDFPEGVRFRVGESSEERDWNYVHWSSVGGKANAIRTETLVAPEISNWTISFDAEARELERSRDGKGEATFTVQLAAAKTAAGNTDVFNATEPYANLPFVVTVNGRELEPWVIP